jgi:GntR family transcriptional repressor for pyruvate dehydrogenase complex
MLIITPDILTYFKENNVCAGNTPLSALEEHHVILQYIIDKDIAQAEKSMREHLSEILNFANENLKPTNNE